MAADVQDLQGLEERELLQRIGTGRRELFGLRLQHATGELENTAGLRATKRELARTLTVARQRGIDLNEHTTSNHG